MFATLKPKRQWSDIGLRALFTSIVAMVGLIIADGLLKRYVVEHLAQSPDLTMLGTWVVDFRFFFEQGIYAATVFFVGAKFFETRTLLTVGFDKLDAEKIQLKGPDEDNVVWIGHLYGSRLEAEAISEAIAERLKQSAA